jgi:hypothetical protein
MTTSLDEIERCAVAEFAEAMRRELEANGHKQHWRGLSLEYLLGELESHVRKLREAVSVEEPARVDEHGADVGNLAMMVRDLFLHTRTN